MGSKKKGASAPRPRSGFVTEEQRGTERLTLRLDPETMARLRSVAAEHGWTIAQCVAEAFRALEREDVATMSNDKPIMTRTSEEIHILDFGPVAEEWLSANGHHHRNLTIPSLSRELERVYRLGRHDAEALRTEVSCPNETTSKLPLPPFSLADCATKFGEEHGDCHANSQAVKDDLMSLLGETYHLGFAEATKALANDEWWLAFEDPADPSPFAFRSEADAREEAGARGLVVGPLVLSTRCLDKANAETTKTPEKGDPR